MSKPIVITVGGTGPYDPVAETTDVIVPSIKGQDFYVGAPGYGPIPYEDYTSLSAGGFQLVRPLREGDIYWIYVTGLNYGNDTTGSYTNGFDFNKVVNALFGRVGWIQTPASPTVNTTNLIKKSGRAFNDGSFHNIVTLNNLKAMMEQVAASDDDFNDFLTSQQRAIILRCLNGVFSDPELISQSLLYDRWKFGTNDTTLPNEGKFVGVQIKIPSSVHLATQIDSVALYFDTAVTFNLYLFNDVKKLPVHTISVTTVANDQTIIDLDDIVLNYIGGANHGGVFYLGYFQDDIGAAKAIRENAITFKCNAPYGALPMTATKTGSTSFSKANVSYSLNTNGINPLFSVFKDHTYQVIKKPSLFDNMIGLQMAAQVIEQGLFSTRSNSTERLVKDGMDKVQAAMELTGVAPISDGPRTTGLRKQIEQEIRRVKESFQPRPKSITVKVC